MINKKSIWFLTLFSLILVLSVYYITMPSELLLNTNGNYTNKNENSETTSGKEPEIVESTVLVALRVEAEEELKKEMQQLQSILTNANSSTDQKNEAYNKMKGLNVKRGEEDKLEAKIKESYNLEAFVKIKDNNIEVVIKSKEHSKDLANKIMRTLQENFEKEMYITVKFTD